MRDSSFQTLGVLAGWVRQGAQKARAEVQRVQAQYPAAMEAGRQFHEAVKADLRSGQQHLAGVARTVRTLGADAAVACLTPAEREALQDRLRREQARQWGVQEPTREADTATTSGKTGRTARRARSGDTTP